MKLSYQKSNRENSRVNIIKKLCKMGEKLIPVVNDSLIVEHGGAVKAFETLLDADMTRSNMIFRIVKIKI